MGELTGAAVLGLLCTKVVDAIKHQYGRKMPPAVPVVLSLVLGIALTSAVGFDMFRAMEIFKDLPESDGSGWWRVGMSGLLVGGLGSGFYEVLDGISTKTSALKKDKMVRRGTE